MADSFMIGLYSHICSHWLRHLLTHLYFFCTKKVFQSLKELMNTNNLNSFLSTIIQMKF